MKKQKMTIEELRELKPSLDNPIELVCDDGHFVDDMEKIRVVLVYNERISVLDKDDDLQSWEASILKHYPSQKPEPRFEKVTVWQNCFETKCETYFLGEGNKAIYFNDKSRHSLTLINVEKIAALKMNSDTFEIVGMWEDGK